MAREDIIKRFEQFLDENNTKDQFFHNMIIHHNKTKKDYYQQQLLYRENESRLIDAAFGWSSSPEGHSFWSILHRKWSKIVQDENLSY